MSEVIVRGAYGRNYQSKSVILKDWNDDKDFKIILTGQYVNKTDAQRYDLDIRFRYGTRMEKTAPLRYIEETEDD